MHFFPCLWVLVFPFLSLSFSLSTVSLQVSLYLSSKPAEGSGDGWATNHLALLLPREKEGGRSWLEGLLPAWTVPRRSTHGGEVQGAGWKVSWGPGSLDGSARLSPPLPGLPPPTHPERQESTHRPPMIKSDVWLSQRWGAAILRKGHP